MLISGKSFTLVLGTLLIAGTLAAMYLPKIGRADETAAKSAESTTPTKQLNQSEFAAAKDLLSRFGIDPDKELSSADASNIAGLFDGIVNNQIENRSYPIPASNKELLDATVQSLKNGPLKKHIQFEEKWDDNHANIEISAPKLALDGFFDPLIHALGSRQRATTSQTGNPITDEEAKFKSAFTVRDNNPIQTRTHDVHPSLRKAMPDAFEGWQLDPYGPQVKFQARWNVDHSRVQITAPKDAQDLLAVELKAGDPGAIRSIEQALNDKIKNIVVLFNGQPDLVAQLEAMRFELAKRQRSLYLYGMKENPTSEQSKRYHLTSVPTCIVFVDGQEVSRLDVINSGEQLQQFVRRTLASADSTGADAEATNGQAKESDSTVAFYTIPVDLMSAVKDWTRITQVNGQLDEKSGRLTMQGRAELHAQLRELLAATPRWRRAGRPRKTRTRVETMSRPLKTATDHV